MKIIWAENPLNTRVELDERDLLLLKEKLKSEYLENRLVSVNFELDTKLLSRNEHKTPEEHITTALRVLDIDYLLNDTKHNNKSFDEWLDESVVFYVQSLLDPHCGDCTCVPCSCLKCHVEDMFGINTIKGLGKHPATKVNTAFSATRDIDEAIRWLSTYQPKHNDPKWVYEQWVMHVPRWVEEGKRALMWLVAYRDEHFIRGKR